MPPDEVSVVYEKLKQEYTLQYAAISRKYSRLSLLRLLTALPGIACIYMYFDKDASYWLIGAAVCLALFLFLLKLHAQAGYQKTRIKTLLQINEEELEYLTQGVLPFASGDSYKEEYHAYAADLDLFGSRSLYQHLNRTATQMGKDSLALALLRQVPLEAIRQRQEAIAEQGRKLEERQELYASARMAGDNKEVHDRLLRWAQQEEAAVPKPLLILCAILAAVLISSLVLYAFTRTALYWDIAVRLFPLNLFIFSLQLKNIRKALFGVDKVHDLLKEYASMLRQVEQASYTSTYMKALQQQLQDTGAKASEQLRKLASIYAGLETVQNPFAAVITNGLYFYHIYMLHRLGRWKKTYAACIPRWLGVIGELEMLHSLSNLHYNNPGFCFPELNDTKEVSFTDLGHPLITAGKRVCNDITFDRERFVILTGSNMSGKSTFLRTLGVNMVLAGAGSAICAAAASVHPLPVFVSMRQSDSLADSESYFFAEVKRLKYIMDQLDHEVCFVLLDEILRGTNSDDKRSGTIGVIEKIIRKNAIGAIATHDLEVCHTTDAYPGVLTNKCFEVEIIDNELVFDYKLREGICKNKSATFLMKKMDIIS